MSYTNWVDLIHLSLFVIGVNYLRLIAKRVSNVVSIYMIDDTGKKHKTTLDKFMGGN